MERAKSSDREAFAAALNADGLAFQAAHQGDVSVNDPARGPVPGISIRRERSDPPGAITLFVTIDADRFDWLAISVTEAEFSSDRRVAELPRVEFAPVFKSSDGGFFVETHVGRLVAIGEVAQYFWTLASARLELDE